MTNTYDTSNEPLGSTAVKVLYNNASNQDEATNSDADTWVDRPPFGRVRRTWRGMENAFDQFLQSTAFELPPLVYVDGSPLQVDRPTQLIERTGILYSVRLPQTFPYTLTGTWATDEPFLTVRTDQALRQDLAEDEGAGLSGFDESVAYPSGTVGARLKYTQTDIRSYGTIGGVDDSAAAVAMLAATGTLFVPAGVTVALKNVELPNNAIVYSLGVLKMPNGSADFTRMLHGDSKTALSIYIKEIDGNAANQVGMIGQHLVYLTNCVRTHLNVDYWHDHYYPTGAPTPSPDGIRDTSTGAIFVYRDLAASVNTGYGYSWGREAVQLRECVRCNVTVEHNQGVAGGGEYSGLQVSGSYNKILKVSVDLAGASGVGFDTMFGEVSNINITRTRENHGVNFGHPGFPATGTVANNIIVDGAYRFGITVASGTQDLYINNFQVYNVGELGVNISDSSSRLFLSNGKIAYAGQANISAAATDITAVNVHAEVFDARTVRMTGVSGSFVAGETVTSGGATGVVRNVLKDRTGAGQILQLSSATGTFAVAAVVTGGTSGATGTTAVELTPTSRRTISGGRILENARLGNAGTGFVIKSPDGTMVFRKLISQAVTANTLATQVVAYPSFATFATIDGANVNVSAASSTNAFTTARSDATLVTTTQCQVNINSSVAQTLTMLVEVTGTY